MIETKTFEIRGESTFIPAICSRLAPSGDGIETEKERYILARSGFRDSPVHVLLTILSSFRCSYASGLHGSAFLATAHEYIEGHWDSLNSGDVIDVDFISGTRAQPRRSEMEG